MHTYPCPGHIHSIICIISSGSSHKYTSNQHYCIWGSRSTEESVPSGSPCSLPVTHSYWKGASSQETPPFQLPGAGRYHILLSAPSLCLRTSSTANPASKAPSLLSCRSWPTLPPPSTLLMSQGELDASAGGSLCWVGQEVFPRANTRWGSP